MDEGKGTVPLATGMSPWIPLNRIWIRLATAVFILLCCVDDARFYGRVTPRRFTRQSTSWLEPAAWNHRGQHVQQPLLRRENPRHEAGLNIMNMGIPDHRHSLTWDPTPSAENHKYIDGNTWGTPSFSEPLQWKGREQASASHPWNEPLGFHNQESTFSLQGLGLDPHQVMRDGYNEIPSHAPQPTVADNSYGQTRGSLGFWDLNMDVPHLEADSLKPSTTHFDQAATDRELDALLEQIILNDLDSGSNDLPELQNMNHQQQMHQAEVSPFNTLVPSEANVYQTLIEDTNRFPGSWHPKTIHALQDRGWSRPPTAESLWPAPGTGELVPSQFSQQSQEGNLDNIIPAPTSLYPGRFNHHAPIRPRNLALGAGGLSHTVYGPPALSSALLNNDYQNMDNINFDLIGSDLLLPELSVQNDIITPRDSTSASELKWHHGPGESNTNYGKRIYGQRGPFRNVTGNGQRYSRRHSEVQQAYEPWTRSLKASRYKRPRYQKKRRPGKKKTKGFYFQYNFNTHVCNIGFKLKTGEATQYIGDSFVLKAMSRIG